MDSNSGSSAIERWQFDKKHHWPVSAALFKISVAFWLCPLPRESVVTVYPFSAAKRMSSSVGSTPVVNTKIIGKVGVDSSKISFKLDGLLWIYSELFIPTCTKCRIAKITRSGRKQRKMIIFFNRSSHFVSHSPGSCASSGIGLSELNQCYHSLKLRLTAAGRPANASGSNRSASVTLSQAWRVNQSYGGFGMLPLRSRTVPPLRKKSYSLGLILPSAICNLTNICKARSSLCLSNSDRQAWL